jgi:hypothetical protein
MQWFSIPEGTGAETWPPLIVPDALDIDQKPLYPGRQGDQLLPMLKNSLPCRTMSS